MFKYNGKIWNPKNPEKKLKQLGITWDDVELVVEEQVNKEEKENTTITKLYYFINPNTGYSITSIYPKCNDADYEPCTKETLERFWNKDGKI